MGRRRLASGARILRRRSFRLLLVSQATVNIASWMQITMLPWLVLRQTGSSLLVGITVALQYMPILIAGPLAGLAADRVPRRTIVVTTQLASVVPAVGLLVAQLRAAPTYAGVLAATIIWGLIQLFDAPARQALIVDSVPPSDTTRALALSISTWHLGSVVGPALVGGLLAAGDQWWPFLAMATLFVLGTAILLRVDNGPHVAPSAPGSGGLWTGIAYARRTPVVVGLLLLVTGFSMFAMNRQALVPLVADGLLHTDSGGFGLLMAASGAGALGGAVFLAVAGDLSPRQHIWLGLGWALALMAFGLSTKLWLSTALLGATGVFQVMFMTIALARLQASTPAGLRGRILALHSQAMTGAAPVGAAQIGLLAGAVGAGPTAVICGALAATVAGTVWAAMPAIRSDKQRHALG